MEKEHLKDINDMLKNIIDNKPKFIATENSYIRLCIYKALEIYALQYGRVWIRRKKEMKSYFSEYQQCYKHKCGLFGACDCCSDPWCCGPNCIECGQWSKCKYAVDVGDFMYKAKVTAGLEIFYDESEVAKLKLKSFPRKLTNVT